MSEEFETADALDAEVSIAGLFASLPRWARTATGVVFFAECALIAAGLARGPSDEPRGYPDRIAERSSRAGLLNPIVTFSRYPPETLNPAGIRFRP